MRVIFSGLPRCFSQRPFRLARGAFGRVLAWLRACVCAGEFVYTPARGLSARRRQEQHPQGTDAQKQRAHVLKAPNREEDRPTSFRRAAQQCRLTQGDGGEGLSVCLPAQTPWSTLLSGCDTLARGDTRWGCPYASDQSTVLHLASQRVQLA